MGLLAVPHDCLEKLGILADVENTNNFFHFSSAWNFDACGPH